MAHHGRRCGHCGAPERPLAVWVSLGETLEAGNWISLVECPVCGTLWHEEANEPYGSVLYNIQWPLSREQWRRLHDKDDGRTLIVWARAEMLHRVADLEPEDFRAARNNFDRHNFFCPLFAHFVSDEEWSAHVKKSRRYLKRTFGTLASRMLSKSPERLNLKTFLRS